MDDFYVILTINIFGRKCLKLLKSKVFDALPLVDKAKMQYKGSKADCKKFIKEHKHSIKRDYVPFRSCDELIKHYKSKIDTNNTSNIPAIWLIDRSGNSYLITTFDGPKTFNPGIQCDCGWISLDRLYYSDFTFEDGSPIGKKC